MRIIRKVYGLIRSAAPILAGVHCAVLSAAAAFACDAVPRTILALHDGRDGAAHRTRIHRHAAMPLNHLGYRLHYVDISAPGRAEEAEALEGVAAVLSWTSAAPSRESVPPDWVADYRDACGERPLRIVLGGIGPSEPDDVLPPGADVRVGIGAEVVRRDAAVLPGAGPVPLRPGRYPGIRTEDPDQSLLRVRADGGVVDLVAVTDRGGYAHDSVLLDRDPRGGTFWIVDPFAFFGRVLGAGTWPVPDPTTRVGRRVYLSTMDGGIWTDPLPGQGKGASATLVGPAAAERFVAPHVDLPVTVALDPAGLDPSFNPGLAERARSEVAELAGRANVELGRVVRGADAAPAAPGPGPAVSLVLRHGHGPSAAGDAIPAMQLDLWRVDLLAPSLSGLPPLTTPTDTGSRVLAPLAVDPARPAFLSLPTMLDLTGTPRRLSPFHLFYEAGAVADPAGRAAVAAYLDLAATGPFAPVGAADYVRDVRGWQSTRIVPLEGDRWRIAERGTLHTVRFDDAAERALDMTRSSGVLGALRHGEALHVALDPAADAPVVALAEGTAASGLAVVPVPPVLSEARHPVRDMRRAGCQTTVRLTSGGETIWWAAPGATLEAAFLRDGTVLRRDRIRADEAGRAVLEGADVPPGTSLELRAPCAPE